MALAGGAVQVYCLPSAPPTLAGRHLANRLGNRAPRTPTQMRIYPNGHSWTSPKASTLCPLFPGWLGVS